MYIYRIPQQNSPNPEGIICFYALDKHIIPSGFGKKTLDRAINIHSLRE
jgi:hypothetical protein